MEAALASGVLKVAGGKLVQLITGEFASIMGVTKDLSELQGLFDDITPWLSRVGDRAIASDPWVRWVKRLKNVAYDIDDLLYEAHLEAEKHKADDNFYAKPKSVLFRFKMACKIKTIKERFAAIVKQRSEFNTVVNNAPVDHPDRRNNRTVGEMSILGNVGESTIRVRDEEKHRIISKLVETNEREKMLTVSIVGLGGSGKTTLAKHICEDKKIKEHFQDAIYWVHVSEEFDVLKLIGKLFEAVAEKKSDLEAQSHMVKVISDKLCGKKFLLVLDDAWHEDRQDWEQFMVTGYLNSGAPGSRILLTTRNKRVSEVVKSTNPFELELLQPDDSWEFFQQCSGWAEEAMDSDFIEVGKDIVSKCSGVPLAIKTLAGVLYDEREIDGWQAIRDSNLLSVQDIQDKVMGSLRLSYFHLRDDLKQCFVLCSIFPKGYMIDKEQLIDQWIAHDMIPPTDGVDHLDLKYKRCFNTLVQLSFLQDVTEDYDRRVTCRMHDLVHDLARSILGDEISLAVPDKTTKSTKSYRYFSLIEQQGNVPPKHFFVKGRAMYVAEGDFVFGKVLKNAKHLRSITVEYIDTKPVLTTVLQIKNLRYLAISQLACETLPEAISDIWSLQALHVTNSECLRVLPKSIGKLQKLRTLNLSGCSKLGSLPDSIGDCQMISSVDLCGCKKLTRVPNSIGRNKNLRVLRLNHTGIVWLPSGITTLGNLEILDLECCIMLVELPKGMNNLKKLKVLNLRSCYFLKGIPVGIKQLRRLQKLGMFIVGEGENFAKISELGNAGGIGGHLTIRNILFVKDSDDAQKARLKHKTNLQSLSLDWFPNLIDECWSNDAEKELAVLNALEPPPSGIECIHVDGYPGGQFARWILKQVGVGKDHPRFPCLTWVRLENFPNLKHLQGLVELPSLLELHLNNMPALESISGGPFPSLVSLEMHQMPSLEEVWMVSEDETSVDHGERPEIQVQIGSRLSYLTIQNCSKLVVKPYLPSSLEHLFLEESNEQLLLSPFRQGQGSSNDAEGLPLSFSHLKWLSLSQMTTSTLSSSSPRSGFAGRGWELLQHLTALDCLHIANCEGLSELPKSMQSLTSLQFLSIHYCSQIRVLPKWLGELRSLQEIKIGDCHALQQLPESLGELRSLRMLTIWRSPCLSSLPRSLQHLTSLQELRIEGCDALHQLPKSLGELRSLHSLSIWGHCLSSLPQSLQHLTSLQKLEIRYCYALHQLPESLGELRSLQEMRIVGCHALQQLPESLRELRSLRMLTIWRSPCLSSLPRSLQHLTSLQELEIGGCDALQQLPQWLGKLCSLRRFEVSSLLSLTGLPRSLSLLTSLEELSIEDCPGLTSLPEWIQGLTALQELRILDCPHLESRCERGKGQDWHLISRIPHLNL